MSTVPSEGYILFRWEVAGEIRQLSISIETAAFEGKRPENYNRLSFPTFCIARDGCRDSSLQKS